MIIVISNFNSYILYNSFAYYNKLTTPPQSYRKLNLQSRSQKPKSAHSPLTNKCTDFSLGQNPLLRSPASASVCSLGCQLRQTVGRRYCNIGFLWQFNFFELLFLCSKQLGDSKIRAVISYKSLCCRKAACNPIRGNLRNCFKSETYFCSHHNLA